MVGRVLLETLRAVADNPHDVANVFRVLYNMTDSEEPAIRIELMDHVPHIAMLCHSEKEKLLYAADHLLPLVAKQLTDPDAQVRKAAQVTLLVLMDQSLVGQTAVEDVVCPVVDILCEPDQNPGNAVQLMCKMAPFLGRESTEKFFLAKFCDLCLYSEIVVRKMCATYFGEFCAVVGPPKTEEFLLSRFVDLCQDDNAEVRKACAEVIMSVSCACTLASRKTVLAPMFVTLLWDSVRWVRSSAFKTLGPFISTFAVPSVADLVYNENGELVLVSREGCEFRLNPNTDGAADIEADEDSLGCDSRKDKLLRRSPQSLEDKLLRRSPQSLGRVPLRYHSQNYSQDIEESEDSTECEEHTAKLQAEHEDRGRDEPSQESSCSNSDLEQEKPTDEESHENSTKGAVQSVAHASESSPVSMESTDPSVPVHWDEMESDEKVNPESITLAGSVTVDSDNSSDTATGKFSCPIESCEEKDHLIDTSESVTHDTDLSNSIPKKSDTRNCSDSISEDRCGPLMSLIKKFNDMEAESESSSECVTLETDLDDDWRSRKTSEVDLGEDLSESSSVKDVSSLTCTPATTPSEESDFNSFQYWRVPIPEISVESQRMRSSRSRCFQSERRSSKLRLKDKYSLSKRPSPPAHRQDTLPQELGEQDIVPQELVEFFVSMTNPPHAPHAYMTDAEVALHCAFSLPAVALTLGRENWKFLRSTYEALAADMQWKVRRTVACSIHELAQILGEELTAKDLVPIYTGLIKDLDEVRIGALKHLADFVKLLPSSERKSFLTQFELFLITDNELNWRFREELAQQLLKIIPLYSPKETCTHLVPVAIALLGDKVAAVRSVALLLVTGLIDHVSSEGPLLRKLLLWLAREFVNSSRWERRQAFAMLCSHLVSGCVLGGDQFAREVLPHLLDLSHDRVPNVRLAVARTIASDFMTNQYFSNDQSPHQEVLNEVLKRLVGDKDRDVRYFADPRRNCSTQSPQLPTY